MTDKNSLADLDKLLAAIDDDPLLNEALGRTPPRTSQGSSPGQSPQTGSGAGSPEDKKRPSGYSSYSVVDGPSATAAPRPGRLEPLGGKAPVAQGLATASHQPVLDAPGFSSVSLEAEALAVPAAGTSEPKAEIPSSAEPSPTAATTGRRIVSDVQLMPYLFSREIVSRGGIAPQRRWSNTVCTHKDSLFTFGGAVPSSGGGPRVTNDFFEFDLVNLTWDPVFCSAGEVPPPRAQQASAIDSEGRFIVHGGNASDGSFLGDTHLYDFQSQEWGAVVHRSKQPPPRADHTATCVGESLYIIGGRTGKKNGKEGTVLSNDVWSLDLRRWRWTHHRNSKKADSATALEGEASEAMTEPSMSCPEGAAPPKRAGHAACALGRWVVIHGGEGASGPLADLWAFDTVSNTWTVLDDGSQGLMPRYRHQLLCVGQSLVAVGGITEYRGAHDPSCTGFVASMQVALDDGDNLVADTRWTAMKINGSPTPPSIRGFGMAMHHGFLCFFGGATAGEASPNNVKRMLLTDGIPVPAVETPHSRLVRSMLELRQRAPAADMKLQLGGRQFSVHRPILALRAPKLLDAVLECHSTKDEKTECPIFGLEGNKRVAGLAVPLTVEQLDMFLDYLYTGQLRGQQNSAAKSAEAKEGATTEDADAAEFRRQLNDLAVTYQVEHLLQVLNTSEGIVTGARRRRAADAVKATKTVAQRRAEASAQGGQMLRNQMIDLSSSTTSVTVTLHVVDPHTPTLTTNVVVHNFILMNRCPMLNKLLRPLFVEARTSVDINGCHAKLTTSRRGKRAEVTLPIPVASVKWVLRYLYAGDDDVPPEAAFPVMIAAHVLGLSSLQAVCESMVARDEVTEQSACASIALATRYEAVHLYEHAVLVAAFCFRQVKHTDAFATLPDSVKDEIARAAREMAGKTTIAPTPSAEMKSKAQYEAQFQRSGQQ